MICYVSSQRIPFDIQCTVKHPENINISAGFDQIGDTVVPIEQHANMPFGSTISVPNFGMLDEHLRSIINATDYSVGRRRIILRYKFANVLEPALSFFCPGY